MSKKKKKKNKKPSAAASAAPRGNNPYPQGLRVTEDEMEFLEGALGAVAEGAQQQGQPQLYNMALGLSQRLRQYTMTGGGVSKELEERLQKGLQAANESRSPERMRRATENFLATMIRLHPDPAAALSAYVVTYLNNVVGQAVAEGAAGGSKTGALAITERVLVKLRALDALYKADGVYPPADQVIAYLIAWTDEGEKSIHNDNEPWEDDDDLQAAAQSQE